VEWVAGADGVLEGIPGIGAKVSRYRRFSTLLFILVHALVFINGYILLILLKQPLNIFLAVHASLMALAGLNLFLGPDLYTRYLRRRARRLDPILVNRAA
jgi:hypothetical protein